jgi:lipoprotein-releasing system ATP-binding protein
MPDSSPIISAVALRKRFDDLGPWVLDGTDLEVACGERVAILGPSGSGKSTLLGILGSLEIPDEGEVLLDGRGYEGLSSDERAALRREAIGFVFQEHHLLPQCTALQNVLLPLLARPTRQLTQGEQQRAVDLLDALGLGDRLSAWPHQLSTGQRQRVAVARALIAQPRLILADEPTGSLDRETASILVNLLLEHSGEAAVVVVTHSLSVALACDRVLEMTDGRLLERGPTG